MSDGKLWYFPLYLHALQFFFLQSQQNFPIYWYISKIYPAYQNQKLPFRLVLGGSLHWIFQLVQLNHFNRIDYLLSIIPLVGIDFNAGSDPFSLTFAQNFNLNESLVCLCRNLFTVKDESHCRIFHILLSFGIY